MARGAAEFRWRHDAALVAMVGNLFAKDPRPLDEFRPWKE